MTRGRGLAAVLGLCLAFPGCVRHRADTVVIVGNQDTARVLGKVELVADGMSFRPNIWKAGTVVVFRVDAPLGAEHGTAGQAYRIDENKKLVPLEAVDVTASDAALAARYGVTVPEKK